MEIGEMRDWVKQHLAENPPPPLSPWQIAKLRVLFGIDKAPDPWHDRDSRHDRTRQAVRRDRR